MKNNNVPVIGFVDPKWRPPRKSKLELQIELEDRAWEGIRPSNTITMDYRPLRFQLTETAKAAFTSGIHFIKAFRKI